MKRIRLWIGLLFFSVTIVFPLKAEVDLLFVGLEAYANANFTQAILAFKKVISSEKTTSPDAFYWLIMAEMSATEYTSAINNADIYLSSFKSSRLYGDIQYQRGRALYHTGRYEDSIRQLYAFFEENPNHELASSAIFWIGECLYALRIFDTALVMYTRVIQEYSFSPKKEAASYRIALIHQQGREEELLRLLKASHEESLRVTEEYQRRERVYEQAVTAYQKRIADILKDNSISDLEKELHEEKIKNISLTEQISVLKDENSQIKNELNTIKQTSIDNLEQLKQKANAVQELLNQKNTTGGN